MSCCSAGVADLPRRSTDGTSATRIASGSESFCPLLTQALVMASTGLFLDGMLGPERRKTGWIRAAAAILCPGRREADVLRDRIRDYALETLTETVLLEMFSDPF